MRQKLQTVSSKERRPHHSRHAQLPSTISHSPQPISTVDNISLDQQREPLLIRRQAPALHPPIYGPVPSSPAHTPVDQYASYLRSVYISKKLPTHSKWPPTAAKKYIHLAIVKKERVSKRQGDEFTKSTLHGNIDDICKKKKAVDFTQIGKKEDGSPAKLILVEGAPGIGKTTFSWKVCRKWAKGKILNAYGLVVLLRLRDKRVQEIKCVADLFYHSDRELQDSVAKEIQRHHGKSVLLLFEGYDELPRNLQTQQSIFLDILHKDFLPDATLLVTSRPPATKFLHWKFKSQLLQHIEILGFTKDDIISYVHDAIEDEHMCRDFFQYLKCYPYIHGMMYVPLNAVIVAEVYKSSQQDTEKFIPTTMTELYTALTRSLLLRYLLSHSEYGQQEWILKKFSDLPQELYEQFNRICEVALKCMIEDKFVHKDLPHDFNTLDLMQSVPELYVEQGASISYNFFHLTLQEFLAAMSISQQPIEEQIHFITESMSDLVDRTKSTPISSGTTPLDLTFLSLSQPQHQHPIPIVPSHSDLMQTLLHLPTLHGRPDYPHLPPPFHQPTVLTEMELDNTELDDTMDSGARFENALRFVAGLTGYGNIPPDSLKHVVLEWHEEFVASISLNSLHWLFEARCINIYSDLVKNVTSLVYNSSGTSMAPFDCFVLGYALSHITFTGHWVIGMIGCHVDDECVEMLASGVNFMSSEGLKNVRITTLVIHDNNITERGATALAEMLKENRTLQQLNVSHNSIGHGGATALVEILKENRTLQQLTVSSNFIGDEGATTLAEMLKENRTLQQLNISMNSIGDGGATALAEMLKENRTLRKLDISHNSVGNGGATALAEMLKENTMLQQLHVNYNSIGVGGATALAEILKENRMLQQLDISHNSVGDGGTTALAEMLKENRTLQQLDISHNSIGIGGATTLAEMLKENRTLQQLHVNYNSIGIGGATALAEILKENRTLQQLDISYNSIGDEGATALAEMLKENRTLQQLDIDYNSIGDGGATALAEMLKENKTLQQLHVSYNSIGDEGATALAEILKENRTLQQLNFIGNSIGDGGATALAEMLKENRTLEQLHVNYNFISVGGATALAEILKENRTLQQLNFIGNSIGNGGATALAEMLKENRTLQQLDIRLNSISDGGATALAEMLKENRTLQQLNVSFNSIGERGATALAEMLKENRTLQLLDVSHNSIGDEGATALAEIQKQNKTVRIIV